jgi:hypothetical protein
MQSSEGEENVETNQSKKKGLTKMLGYIKIQLTSVKGGLDTENPVHQCEQKTCVQKLVDLQPISCMEYHNLPFLSYFDKLTSTNFLGGVKVLYVFLVDPLPFSSSKQKGP